MKNLNSVLIEFSKFIMGGGVNFALNTGLTYVLTEYLGLYYLSSFILVQTVLVIYGYFYNLLYTFKIPSKSKKRFFKFLVFLVLFFGVNIALVKILTETVTIPYMFSIVVTIFITTTLKFFTYKKFVFKN